MKLEAFIDEVRRNGQLPSEAQAERAVHATLATLSEHGAWIDTTRSELPDELRRYFQAPAAAAMAQGEDDEGQRRVRPGQPAPDDLVGGERPAGHNPTFSPANFAVTPPTTSTSPKVPGEDRPPASSMREARERDGRRGRPQRRRRLDAFLDHVAAREGLSDPSEAEAHVRAVLEALGRALDQPQVDTIRERVPELSEIWRRGETPSA